MVKILVAEDERDIRELIAYTLMFAGYEVVQASNGAEAVDMATAGKTEFDTHGCTDAAYDRLSSVRASQAKRGNKEYACHFSLCQRAGK